MSSPSSAPIYRWTTPRQPTIYFHYWRLFTITLKLLLVSKHVWVNINVVSMAEKRIKSNFQSHCCLTRSCMRHSHFLPSAHQTTKITGWSKLTHYWKFVFHSCINMLYLKIHAAQNGNTCVTSWVKFKNRGLVILEWYFEGRMETVRLWEGEEKEGNVEITFF